MNIRKGIKEDMPAVLGLIKELATFEKEPNAVVVTIADLKRDGFGESPLFHTFIAEENEEIVGMALYYYRYSTWKGKTIHLEDLVVTEKMRGKGIGLSLYKSFLKEAKKQGVNRVEWSVLDWNKPAINFYLKSGALIDDYSKWKIVRMNKSLIEKFLSS